MRTFFLFMFCLMLSCQTFAQANQKSRVLVLTDIGGTDPDDFQSMIHYLMYADQFQTEGLIASPYGEGRKKNILEMIDLYERDYPKLKQHGDFPEPDFLRSISKQGAESLAPAKGWSRPSEGSEWIIEKAKTDSDRPLWILVWGGLDDVAQALHDAPEIKEKIRVYWIGGPNKKWSINAYAYIAENHPDLWMIEANATYRGWFMDEDSPENLSNKAYYANYIQGHGFMGDAFKNYYEGIIKMGDTPSVTYLMNGKADDPLSDSWGGSFTPIKHSSRSIFDRNTTIVDTVVAYAVLEWRFKGPVLAIPQDSVCFTMEIWNQVWPGYYYGEGVYGVKYSSKKAEVGTYTTSSHIPELDGHTGQYVSITPWPGKSTPDDYLLGDNWYGDRSEPEYFIEVQQGAKTVSKHREAFLSDWAKRWEWLNAY